MLEKSKIMAEHSLEANYLKIQWDETEIIDNIAVNMIKNDRPDFLLPMRTLQFNHVLEFKYTIGNQTAIEYKEMTCSKRQFLLMYKAMIDPFVQCGDWLLDYHYLYIDSGYVFVDKSGKTASYLYIPAASAKNTDAEILQFFASVLNRVTITDDPAFLVELYRSFNSPALTLAQLYQLIAAELLPKESAALPKENAVLPNRTVLPEPKNEPPKVKTEPITNSHFPGSNLNLNPNPVLNADMHSDKQGDVVDVLFGGGGQKKEPKAIFGGGGKKKEPKEALGGIGLGSIGIGKKKEPKADLKEKKGGLWGNKRKNKQDQGQQIQEQQISPNPAAAFVPQRADYNSSVPQQMDYNSSVPQRVDYNYTMPEENDYTEVGSGCEVQSSAYLQLESTGLEGIPSRVALDFNKEQITFGRKSNDRIQPDVVFPSNYKKIGRMHACIRKENDTYYLVDLGSLNGSALNNEPLVPNHPYPLQNQDEISFVVSDPVKYRVFL